MADYFTHFSCLIDVGSPEKAARALALFHDLRAADQDADDPEVSGFTLACQDAPEDTCQLPGRENQRPNKGAQQHPENGREVIW